MTDPTVTDGTGKKWRVVTQHYIDMGRRKRTRMILKDVKVDGGRCIVSVEMRRGANSWTKGFEIPASMLEREDFEQALFARIRQEALKLEEDKLFNDRVLMRLEHHIGEQIYLD